MTSSAPKIREDAIKTLRTGKTAEGIALLQQALALDPASADTLNALGAALWQTGQVGEAEKNLREALRLDPAHAHALANLAILLHRRGRLAKAEGYYRAAIKANPASADLHLSLGAALADLYRLDEAEKSFRRALEINPRHGGALSGLGTILNTLHRNDEAETCFRRALEINPKDERSTLMLAVALEMSNRLEDAEKAVAEGLAKFPGHPGLCLVQAKIMRRRKMIPEAIELLETAAARMPSEGGHTTATSILYELGQLYDRQEDSAKAFDAFTKANQKQAVLPGGQVIDKEIFPALLRHYRAVFTRPWIESWAPLPQDDPDHKPPVFLVGFPRSGTTLLDQILSGHPDIAVAEERPVVDQILRQIDNYAQGLAALSPEHLAVLRRAFFDLHAHFGLETTRPIVIDRMPLNMVHAGTLYRLFPKAKFILALRHPCDCVLSAFMQQFTPNEGLVHCLTLEGSATLYDDSFSLWEHYRSLLPLNVHAVRYEDVVTDFRPAIEGLLKFLEVPWHDSVLEHDKTAKSRKVKTASYSQVTEKIYTRAKDRWTRYRQQMAPVLDVLRPWAERYGYRMEDDG